MVHPNVGVRSMTEVIIAVVFVGFLTGFVTVLCIGNYYRAKIAMERQRQRRLERYTISGGGGVNSSPKSNYSSGSTRTSDGGSYTGGGLGIGENHNMNPHNENIHLLSAPPDIPRRRQPPSDFENNDLLLFHEQDDILVQQQNQNRRPNVMRV
jgi:hypothetical protein